MKKKKDKLPLTELFGRVSTTIVGLAFFVAWIAKTANVEDFVEEFSGYTHMTGLELSIVVGLLLGSEFSVGACMIFRRCNHFASKYSTLLLATFIVFLTVMPETESLSCGCFQIDAIDDVDSGYKIAMNAVLLGLSIMSVFFDRTRNLVEAD